MIWITQCICPNDHNRRLWAWDDTQTNQSVLQQFAEDEVVRRIDTGLMPPRCPICLATERSYTHEITHWQSLDQAEPVLRRASGFGQAAGEIMAALAKAQRRGSN